MDRTTEPVIAVLGYPIAGNAAQFALQRAFAAMRLDWQVLSFDVAPEHLSLALDGLAVLGVEGVLIDENLAGAGCDWLGSTLNDTAGVPLSDTQHPLWFDVLYRSPSSVPSDPGNSWSASHAAAAWLLDTTRDHFATHGRSLERWSQLGAGSPAALESSALLEALTPLIFKSEPVAFEANLVDSLNLIVVQSLEDHRPAFEDWPRNDCTTLVIDLSRQHDVPESLADRGYRLITVEDIQVGMLRRCIQTWTKQCPPIDVLREAIEEYSAV